jgi:hypothetical protein
MVDGVKLEPGERVIFRSARGGAAGYSGGMWLLILFGASQICGGFMMVPFLLKNESGDGATQISVMTIVTLVVSVVVLVRWIMMKVRPAYFITDRRLIARRLLLPPVVIDLENVGGAVRVLVQYTRYGRVVNELLTHRVGVAFHSGGSRKFGPIKDADDFASLLQGVAEGIVDCKALPDADGGLAPAEARSDLFFARATLTGGAPRGPVFVGPGKVTAFAEPFFSIRLNQVLTIAGAQRRPEEIEASMLAIAQSAELRGRAVVMDREGLNLAMDGRQLKLSSGDHTVAFDLAPEDADRAAKFVKRAPANAYR